jgi:hypothetical protein
LSWAFLYPFSFTYAITSYGCCSCCSCSTRVEKEEKVVATQEHKNQQAKKTLKTQSQEGKRLEKIYCFQN